MKEYRVHIIYSIAGRVHLQDVVTAEDPEQSVRQVAIKHRKRLITPGRYRGWHALCERFVFELNVYDYHEDRTIQIRRDQEFEERMFGRIS